MPTRTLRICSAPGCGKTINSTARRCEAHPYPVRPARPRSAQSRAGITGADWRKLRRFVLARDRICRAHGCSEVPSHVDHIIARDLGGSSDPSNLQALCHSCHSRKTAREDGGFGNRKRFDA